MSSRATAHHQPQAAGNASPSSAAHSSLPPMPPHSARGAARPRLNGSGGEGDRPKPSTARGHRPHPPGYSAAAAAAAAATELPESIKQLPDIMPSRASNKPARVAIRQNIAARLATLRRSEDLQEELAHEMNHHQHIRRAAREAQLSGIEERHAAHNAVSFEERRRQVIAQRREVLTQRVMEPGAMGGSVIPQSRGDGLAIRRWVVLVVTPLAFRQFALALIKARLISKRHSRADQAVLCLDPNEPLAESMHRWRALQRIENAAVRFAVNRRVRVKRNAINDVRCFLRVRAYMYTLRRNVRIVRQDFIRCQRMIRRWRFRRMCSVLMWLDQWVSFDEAHDVQNMPDLTLPMARWYKRIARKLLENVRVTVAKECFDAHRKWHRDNGAALGVAEPQIRTTLFNRDLMVLSRQARAIISDWVAQVDAGTATGVELWEATFGRPPAAATTSAGGSTMPSRVASSIAASARSLHRSPGVTSSATARIGSKLGDLLKSPAGTDGGGPGEGVSRRSSYASSSTTTMRIGQAATAATPPPTDLALGTARASSPPAELAAATLA